MEPELSNGERVLNKLEEFRQKQRQLEWEQRKQRNAEVDQLISKLGDPKVAEKLRIYRLVEEQFCHIESEVEREVKAELEAKKATRKVDAKIPINKMDLKKAGNLLHKARSLRVELAKEIEEKNAPAFIKDNLLKVKAEREFAAKQKLLGPRFRKTPVEQTFYKPAPIKTIPKVTYITKKPTKSIPKGDNNNDGIVMLSKPVIRDRHRGHSRNVGYVAYSQVDEVDGVEEERQRTKSLSAHILTGINISPKPQDILMKIEPVSTIDVVKELASFSNKDEPTLPVIEDKASKSSSEPEVLSKLDPVSIEEEQENVNQETRHAAVVESSEPEVVENEGKTEEFYSDSFEEEDDENPDDLLQEFIPKIMAMREFAEEDSLTGRLSTIPEVPSQATSIDDSNKLFLEGSLDSSSSSLITSPIRIPTKKDTLEALSLSEGPMVVSEESSSLQLSKHMDEEVSLVLSEGPIEKPMPVIPITKIDQAVMTTTLCELDLTPSERKDADSSQQSEKKESFVSLPCNSTSSSSVVASSTSTNASFTTNSEKTEDKSDLGLSEGQVVVPHSLLLSEGELPLDSKCIETNSDSSLKDSLEEGEA